MTKGCKKDDTSAEESSAVKFVRESVNSNKVIVFIGSDDPFSIRALSSLRRSGVKAKLMTSIDISGSPEEDLIRDRFMEISDGRSLPRVFVKGKFIGGASDLEYLEMTGELQELLKKTKCFKAIKPM